MKFPRAIVSLAMAAALAAVETAPHAVQAQEGVDWQTAVSRLAYEKTRAEACVSARKALSEADKFDLIRAELEYSEAKADVDRVIAALVLSLTKDENPEDLETLTAQLQSGIAGREEFCAETWALIPSNDENTRGIFGEAVGKAVAPLIAAIVDLYKYHDESDVVLRQTIGNQLEAKTWLAFDEIQ